MKNNLFVGVDYIGDEDIRLNNDVKHKTKWDVWSDRIIRFFEKMGPLRSDIRHIEARYDKSITNFFVFFRFIYYLSLGAFLIFLYLCIKHITVYLSLDDNVYEICDSYYPCSFFYARFKSSMQLSYSMTLFLFILYGYGFCLY